MLINNIEKSGTTAIAKRPAAAKPKSDTSFADTMEELFTADAVELTSSTDDHQKRKQNNSNSSNQEVAESLMPKSLVDISA